MASSTKNSPKLERLLKRKGIEPGKVNEKVVDYSRKGKADNVAKKGQQNSEKSSGKGAGGVKLLLGRKVRNDTAEVMEDDYRELGGDWQPRENPPSKTGLNSSEKVNKDKRAAVNRRDLANQSLLLDSGHANQSIGLADGHVNQSFFAIN